MNDTVNDIVIDTVNDTINDTVKLNEREKEIIKRVGLDKTGYWKIND